MLASDGSSVLGETDRLRSPGDSVVALDEAEAVDIFDTSCAVGSSDSR
jgi:hypothetical protein